MVVTRLLPYLANGRENVLLARQQEREEIQEKKDVLRAFAILETGKDSY